VIFDHPNKEVSMFKRIFVIFAILAMSVSCSKLKEEGAQTIANGLSPAIAKYGDCSGVENINSSVLKEVDRWLGNSRQKSMGNLCSVAVSAVVPVLVGEALDEIPENWGCKLTSLSGKLDEIADDACSKL